MYQPPHFREDDLDVQHALIRAHPLGLLITAGAEGLVANALPFHLDFYAFRKGNASGPHGASQYTVAGHSGWR